MSIREDGDQSTDEEDAAEDGDDDRAYQACYQFVPRRTPPTSISPPRKRQKTAHQKSNSFSAESIFPLLLRGRETESNAQSRYIKFQRSCSEEESTIARLVKPVDTSLLDECVHFVEEATCPGSKDRLPTGLILSRPSAGSQARLLELWLALERRKKTTIGVQLDSAQTPNLMVTLRNLIRSAIVQLDDAEGYRTFVNSAERKTKMNFDLELLQEFMALREVHECVIHLVDIEAFDTGLLNDLVSLLHSWMDRIPLVLLIGVSTTVGLLESRLSKSTIRLLDCKLFDATGDTDLCGKIFNHRLGPDNSCSPCLGPATGSVLLDLSREQDVSVACFIRAVKYANMSHYFTNALSVLVEEDPKGSEPTRDLCEAIRSTDSFRRHVEEKLNGKEYKSVCELLYNDKALFCAAREAVAAGKAIVSQNHLAVDLFLTLLNAIGPASAVRDPFLIEVQALSGAQFLESAVYNDVVSTLTTLPSDQMRTLLITLQDHKLASELQINTRLETLDQIAPPPATTAPLRSGVSQSTHITTLVQNNKVPLSQSQSQSRHGSKPSFPSETEYAHLVNDLTDSLSDHFEHAIHNPSSLFLYEAFVYDAKSPLGTVFNPRPRQAIERALSRPHDYLGCTCCDGQSTQQTTSPTQPAPTSILWRLWCEAGAVVNVYDLWDAFLHAVVVVVRDEDEDEDEDDDDDHPIQRKKRQSPSPSPSASIRLSSGMNERTALALFYRGVAELRMMGFLKSSSSTSTTTTTTTRRKVDCLVKTAWRGL